MLIAPSILSSDFWRLNEEIKIVDSHCDFIHVDVMDGHFVPNLTIGPPIVKCIKSEKPIDCHLMIDSPEKFIEEFIISWAQAISTHIELWEKSILICSEICKKKWIKYWIAINPETPVDTLWPVIGEADFILVMSVHPWFWGQTFIMDVLEKVKEIKKKEPDMIVEIDWWINDQTIKNAKEAWVDIAVAWSYIFKAEDRVAAIASLKI